MATCPECFSHKWWLAPRCPECNEEIGFIRQTIAQIIITTGFVIGCTAIYYLFRLIFG